MPEGLFLKGTVGSLSKNCGHRKDIKRCSTPSARRRFYYPTRSKGIPEIYRHNSMTLTNEIIYKE